MSALANLSVVAKPGNALWLVCFLTSCLASIGLNEAFGSDRSRTSFNQNWRFARFGTMPNGSNRNEPQGLEKADFQDQQWRVIKLPHDWGIEGPIRQDLPGRTGKLPWPGIGWYRKQFDLPASDRGKRIFVDFDGAMSDSTVFVNGQKAGGWPYGYSSFRVELTDYVRFGVQNVIAVRLDNKSDSSRWYPGGGIYRNTWLLKTNALHIDHWGTFVTTPEVSQNKATVEIAVTIRNQADTETTFTLATELQGPLEDESSDGRVLATASTSQISLAANGETTTTARAQVDAPRFWSLDERNLYVADTKLIQDGIVVDEYRTVFGIRQIDFDSERGFLLNGKRSRLHGVCLHHDLGPLGAAVNKRAIQRQIELLQEMGCNAIRTSHNPPAPELLDLCDQMGMLVQVEAFDCWEKGKTANDYSRFFPQWHEKDLSAMVRRDRNHPSVIMWSTGNEIREQGNQQGHRLSQKLSDIVRQLDSTRPVTAGCNNGRAGNNGFQRTVDVFGYNYKPHLYPKFRKQNPGIPLYGSETASCISSRGEYFFPVDWEKSGGRGGPFQMSSYDLYAPRWASRPDIEFEGQDRFPAVLGEFVWTGFDYLGEPTPYNEDVTNLLNTEDPKILAAMKKELEELGKIRVPSRSSYFGILDLCGFKKDRYFLYQSRWQSDLPMAHILPHWNWPERVGQLTPVHVYTSGDTAELFVNGRSLGKQKKGPYQYRLAWKDVVYEPGELRVVTYKNGKKWAEAVKETTGAAAVVRIATDRSTIYADGTDLAYLTVRIEDSKQRLVPRASNLVQFTVDGPGEIVAVGNGDATSHQPFQADSIRAYNGLCLVIVRALERQPGTITVRANSEGLEVSSTQISTHH